MVESFKDELHKLIEVRHGQTCAEGSSLGSIGYLAHYGVANDSYFPHYLAHKHVGWDGPGWSADNQDVSSPALIVEAARRFLASTPNCNNTSSGSGLCVIVFSSMLWDMARHCAHFSRQPLGKWSVEFLANYSAVASALQTEVSHAPGARLVLTTGYLISEKVRPYTNPNGSSCFTSLAFETAANDASRLVAAQLRVPLIDLESVFIDLYPNRGLTPYLRDNIHADKIGLDIQWAAVRATLDVSVGMG